MRWLLICLLVSLGALLLAAAGLARHIWLKHRELNANAKGTHPSPTGGSREIVEEIDVESEV